MGPKAPEGIVNRNRDAKQGHATTDWHGPARKKLQNLHVLCKRFLVMSTEMTEHSVGRGFDCPSAPL
jgi:hypothetical protein